MQFSHISLTKWAGERRVCYCQVPRGHHLLRSVKPRPFQEHGKIPLVSEVFIVDVITGRVAERLSLITRAGILSIPGYLFNGIDRTSSATSSEHSTGALQLN